MRLIVTRPEEDAVQLISKLERAGHSALAAPMIRIRNLPAVSLPLSPWQAILVTSANSIRALTVLPAGTDLKSVPVLAVGPASAKAANIAGFANVTTANGNLDALTALALAKLDPAAGPVLYPSGTVISGDLKAKLEAHGFSCTRVPLYEAEPASSLSAQAADEVRAGTADGVLLFSPRTARIWAKCLAAAELTAAASSLTHCCLSTAVAEALLESMGPGVNLKSVTVAPEPNEDSLVEAVGAV